MRGAAELDVICTGQGTHKRIRLGGVVLNPIVDGVTHFGVYSKASAQGGRRDVERQTFLGVTAKDGTRYWRFGPCRYCPERFLSESYEALRESMEEGNLAGRATTVDISTGARLH